MSAHANGDAWVVIALLAAVGVAVFFAMIRTPPKGNRK